MKRRRRKTRRGNDSPFAQVVGAWEEYLDLSVDYGAPIPKNKTRLEIARESNEPELLELAELANLMAYGSSEVTSVDITDQEIDAAAARSWEIFDAHREVVTSQTKGIKQIMAVISLRSFIRVLKPKEELKKLTSSISFNKGNKVSEGSGAAALFQAMKSQARGLFAKK
jgi:D-ribose pyranose/furanose isomerase RbsD